MVGDLSCSLLRLPQSPPPLARDTLPPEGYWPSRDARADAARWEHTIASYYADRQALQEMVADPSVDLYAQIPHGTGQTILREILLVADHTAYHLGEFALLRQVMPTWRTHEQR